MNRRFGLLPFPLLSLTLALVWLLLANSIAPAHLLLALALGFGLPLWWRRFWVHPPQLHRPWLLMRYILMLFWDIVVANIHVAALVLGPNRKLRPAFIRVPMELHHEVAITILTGSISLAPGTVSARISADRRSLLVHTLHTTDPTALIAEIKQRYEQPLKEIFEC